MIILAYKNNIEQKFDNIEKHLDEFGIPPKK